jgi:hypothetical protein
MVWILDGPKAINTMQFVFVRSMNPVRDYKFDALRWLRESPFGLFLYDGVLIRGKMNQDT